LPPIELKKKIFRRWMDEKPHIGDIPTNEGSSSLVEERSDLLLAFYYAALFS
jgi:hypothetical protein